MTVDLEDRTSSSGNSGPEISTLLSNGASDGRTLHFTLGVNNDTSVILKVNKGTIGSSPGLSLSNNDSRGDLLSEFGLTLLAGGNDHVTNRSGGQSVKSTLDTTNTNDIQVLTTRVISAVHDGSNGQTQGGTELSTNTSSSYVEKASNVIIKG